MALLLVWLCLLGTVSQGLVVPQDLQQLPVVPQDLQQLPVFPLKLQQPPVTLVETTLVSEAVCGPCLMVKSSSATVTALYPWLFNTAKVHVY